MSLLLILTQTDYSWLWSSLIGILGVILGTLLGWFLNNLSRFGEIDLYVTSWLESFKYYKNGLLVPATSYEESRQYSYHLSIDLSNNSGKHKILRDIKIEFYNGDKLILSNEPYNSDECISTKPLYLYKHLGIINIHANTALQINLHGVSSEIDTLKNTTCVFLKYKNEKNKTIRILINKHDHKNFIAQYEKNDNN